MKSSKYLRTQDYLQALKSKHPAPEHPIRLPIPDLIDHTIGTPELTVDTVRRGVNSAPKESRRYIHMYHYFTGACGLRYEHLRELIRGPDDSLLQVLTTFMNRLITGKGAPNWYYTFLGSARLIGLSKPGKPGDIRPIAMGGVLPKLISLCLHRLLQSTFDQYFEPYQLGVGKKRGSETMFKYIQKIQEAHPERVILKIDFRNAFRPLLMVPKVESENRLFPIPVSDLHALWYKIWSKNDSPF